MFDGSLFLPRGQCCVGGEWPDGWAAAYIWANVLVCAAYFVNPAILVWWNRVGNGSRIFRPWSSLAIVYAAFIFFCGAGHLLDGVASFWWPAYGWFTVWHWCTAAASWTANFAIVSAIIQHRNA